MPIAPIMLSNIPPEGSASADEFGVDITPCMRLLGHGEAEDQQLSRWTRVTYALLRGLDLVTKNARVFYVCAIDRQLLAYDVPTPASQAKGMGSNSVGGRSQTPLHTL
ncbi:hypothetical protein COCCADRAFT_10487 [Bipolaris zeicola 26-R-13]|uniref:Uncharacterized protein n=1 Tax=Cochliobolus carbonum (strain 26-R-13) TaxID=930089 RepID=W6XVC0_COCC2|nr:uncharacterized protein COCCADRAFT_10487 [Bipolaris zeicola 26-R-13]EUC26714.1 hypothetical protein COCCADRAFT_10487 [Bipolaris zeicola 26-R-13]